MRKLLLETPEIKIALTVLIIIASAVIILILLRSMRLWYWRTDKIIGSLENIDSRMDNIERGMDSIKISTEKLIAENERTNAVLASLKNQVEALPEAEKYVQISGSSGSDEETTHESLSENDGAAADDAGAERVAEREEKNELKEQFLDLEKEFEELKKQKAQLEADINARIRD